MLDATKAVPNRLIRETSPYLLQHAHQGVDWWPWCQEAFDRAKAQDKPVFLSIGYSSCHWCHVMSRESFEDPQVAELLNGSFVPIKVDREERPDIDSVYMQACLAFTGSGGWPMTLLMDGDKRPFFAGTYFPKRRRYGRPGLLELLEWARNKWEGDREKLLENAALLTAHVSGGERALGSDAPEGEELMERAARELKDGFDPRYGGFGPAPKFPMAHTLLFLLAYDRVAPEAGCLQMAETTLRRMAQGGIFDQIGYGFSRYSTDEKWLAPHFEKMLYDNALLLMAYAAAYGRTHNPLYSTVGRKIVTYLRREMTHPQGGFYSAQDADSQGKEGKYYLLTPGEVEAVLGQEMGRRWCALYDITPQGNFEGASIPNQIALAGADHSLDSLAPKLYAYRKARMALPLDDKVLTAWNGLMIAALCDAYRAFGKPEDLVMARRASAFVREKLSQGEKLFITYREGARAHAGLLDDYAFMAYGQLQLYRVTLEPEPLHWALALVKKALADFFDPEKGGFYLSGTENEALIARPKETSDGAMPSGNSVMAMNLALLSMLLPDSGLEEALEKQMAFLSLRAARSPESHAFFLLALLQRDLPGRKITVVLAEQARRSQVAPLLPKDAWITILERETEAYPLLEGKTTYYVCENGTCAAPSHQVEARKGH